MKRSVSLLAHALDMIGLPQAALAARRKGLWWPTGLTVLCYHRVAEPEAIDGLDPDLVDATPAEFDEQMAYLRRNFQPVSVDEVLTCYRAGRALPAGSVLVTFDDGYRDNHDLALPILRRHGVQALFFITTDHLDRRRLFWWEQISLIVRRCHRSSLHLDYPASEELDLSTPAARSRTVWRLNRIVKDRFALDLDRFLSELARAADVPWDDAEATALADRTLMTWEHVRAMRAAGMGIGSHTSRHRVLQTLRPDDLASELRGSRARLERELGEPVTTIAYPVGRRIAHLAPIRQALADAGYELGFTTAPGRNLLERGVDPFDLRRLAINRGTPLGLAHLQLAFPSLAR